MKLILLALLLVFPYQNYTRNKHHRLEGKVLKRNWTEEELITDFILMPDELNLLMENNLVTLYTPENIDFTTFR
jgi:hypothetical protein